MPTEKNQSNEEKTDIEENISMKEQEMALTRIKIEKPEIGNVGKG